MTLSNEAVYNHKYLGSLSKVELDLYFDFLAKVISNLSGFEVWEAENVISEEENKMWENQIIDRYVSLLEIKTELKNNIK